MNCLAGCFQMAGTVNTQRTVSFSGSEGHCSLSSWGRRGSEMSGWLEWGVLSSLWELEELIKPQEGLSSRVGKIPNANPTTNTHMAHAGSPRPEGRGVEKMTSDL